MPEPKPGVAIDKACPRCPNGRLQLRINSHNGSQFLGCTNYPFCRQTEPIPEYLKLRAAGAEQLPGMEAL